MREGCCGRRLARSRTSSKWLVSSVFATAIMAGQAYAKQATDNITTVLSPNSFTQQDKTGGDWTEVISNLPSGFTTLITMRSNIVLAQDRHTVLSRLHFFPLQPIHRLTTSWSKTRVQVDSETAPGLSEPQMERRSQPYSPMFRFGCLQLQH